MCGGRRRIGFEVKFSSAPRVSRGFWQAIEDLKLDAAYVVAPVTRGFPLAGGVEVVGVHQIPGVLAG